VARVRMEAQFTESRVKLLPHKSLVSLSMAGNEPAAFSLSLVHFL